MSEHVAVEMVACSMAAYCDRCGVAEEPWLSVRWTLVRRCAGVCGASEAWTRRCLSKARRASAVGEAREPDDEFVVLWTPERLLLERGAGLDDATARDVVDVLKRLAECDIRAGVYDAVTRAVIKRCFRSIKHRDDWGWDLQMAPGEQNAVRPTIPLEDDFVDIGGGVMVERPVVIDGSGEPAQDLDSESLRQSERKMWLGMSVAAVGGGALLALTGGAAAPSLAASILGVSAMGADSVAACITGVFGALGAGISGFKARRRFAPVQDFRLAPLRSPRVGVARFYLVPGWADPARDAADPWGQNSICTTIPVALSSSWDDLDSPIASTTIHRGQQPKDDDDEVVAKDFAFAASVDDDDDDGLLLQGAPPPPPFALEATTTTAERPEDEWTTSTNTSPTRRQKETKDGALDWWRDSGHSSFETAEVVIWEEEALERLHTTMTETTLWVQARDRAARSVADEILRRSALGAASIPLALLEQAAALDDPWAIAIRRAKVVGKLLADELFKQLSGGGGVKPVTLVGYSIGARVVMHCLEALDDVAQDHPEALGLVENAVLLGAPVAATPNRWIRARRVVAGRLVNGYSTRDWMLRLVYRTKAWSIAGTFVSCFPNFLPGVAGAEPVRPRDDDAIAPRIENLDLSDMVNCHLAYPHLMQPIFARLALET